MVACAATAGREARSVQSPDAQPRSHGRRLPGSDWKVAGDSSCCDVLLRTQGLISGVHRVEQVRPHVPGRAQVQSAEQ
jgi:hypothetical protein